MLPRIKQSIKQLLAYKSALAGLIIIFILIMISIYTVFAIPYSKATELWRAGEQHWLENPRNAMPSWVNIFSFKKLPETIVLDTEKMQPGASKAIIPVAEKFSKIKIESVSYTHLTLPTN